MATFDGQAIRPEITTRTIAPSGADVWLANGLPGNRDYGTTVAPLWVYPTQRGESGPAGPRVSGARERHDGPQG